MGKLRPLSLPERFRIALKVTEHQSREAWNLSDRCNNGADSQALFAFTLACPCHWSLGAEAVSLWSLHPWHPA